jgi:hypothetical protein
MISHVNCLYCGNKGEYAEGYHLNLTVSPWSGYSQAYTQQLLDDLETFIRKHLDSHLGYLNDKNVRNYIINTYEDWDSRTDWSDDND